MGAEAGLAYRQRPDSNAVANQNERGAQDRRTVFEIPPEEVNSIAATARPPEGQNSGGAQRPKTVAKAKSKPHLKAKAKLDENEEREAEARRRAAEEEEERRKAEARRSARR